MSFFLINVVKFYAKPLRNWTFQRFVRAAQKKGRNGINKKSDTRWESNPGPRLFQCRCINLLCHGCQWQDLNFYPYKLSDLKFTPLPSLHVDFYSRHVVNSVLFFLHNCPLLIPLHNTAVLIKICRFFLISVVKFYAKPLRNWTFQRFVRAAQKKGRNGINKKSDTRWESNPGPRLIQCRCINLLCHGCQWQDLNFYTYKLSDFKFTRCLPFMWTFIHDMLLIVFYFFLHNCPLLIPLHNTAVLIKICRFV